MARPRVEHIKNNKQTCRRCKETKLVEDFWKSAHKDSGISQYCKKCSNKNRKEYRDRKKTNTCKFNMPKDSQSWNSKKGSIEYKDYIRNSQLQRAYGISLEEYNLLFQKQAGKCAVCGRHQVELGKGLYVDHCHTTGTVRGLLCSNCNTGIGLFKDSIEIFYQAIGYLERNYKKINIPLALEQKN